MKSKRPRHIYTSAATRGRPWWTVALMLAALLVIAALAGSVVAVLAGLASPPQLIRT